MEPVNSAPYVRPMPEQIPERVDEAASRPETEPVTPSAGPTGTENPPPAQTVPGVDFLA